jgi:hypothetical protein
MEGVPRGTAQIERERERERSNFIFLKLSKLHVYTPINFDVALKKKTSITFFQNRRENCRLMNTLGSIHSSILVFIGLLNLNCNFLGVFLVHHVYFNMLLLLIK